MSNILQKPKNDWAKALYILYQTYSTGLSMAVVLTRFEPCFYKFQARLGEVEKHHPKLELAREMIPYTSNLDGKKRKYMLYRVKAPQQYVLNLYNKINEKGLLGSVTPSSSQVTQKSISESNNPKFTEQEMFDSE